MHSLRRRRLYLLSVDVQVVHLRRRQAHLFALCVQRGAYPAFQLNPPFFLKKTKHILFFSVPDFCPADSLLRELPLSPFLLSALKHAAVPFAEAVGGSQKDPPKYTVFVAF